MPPKAQRGTFTWALWQRSSLEGKIYLACALIFPFTSSPITEIFPFPQGPFQLNIFPSEWWKTVVLTLSHHSPLWAHTYWKLEAHQGTPQFLISNLWSLPFPNNLCSLKIHFHHKDHLVSAHDRWYRSVIFWLQDNYPPSLIILAPSSSTQSLLFPLKGNVDTDNLSRLWSQGRTWPFQQKCLLFPLYFCHLLTDITVPWTLTGKGSSLNA